MLMPTHANLIIWCDSQALILNWVKNEKNVFYKLYDKLVMLQYDILFKSLQPESFNSHYHKNILKKNNNGQWCYLSC